MRENELTVGLQDKEAENSRLQEELRECQGLLERNKVLLNKAIMCGVCVVCSYP